MIKTWYDDYGYVYAVLVSEDAPDDVLGLFLGPPSLADLHIDPVKEKKLREKLVAYEFYDAPALMGQRPALFEILAEVGIPRDRLRDLISLFQRDYDGDRGNG